MAVNGVDGATFPSRDVLSDSALPIFNVERVQLQFSLSGDLVAAQVANNVLVLALSTGRILRIDLDSPADIDDIDLPKKPAEVGIIRRLFLDPSASHLIVNTTSGENFYLHTQSRQPKVLSKLKSVAIECVAWNPSLPTASTREILIGAADGNVYETYVEPTTEFYRSQDRYVTTVYKVPDGAVTGLRVGLVEERSDLRRILIASANRLLDFVGKVGRSVQSGSGSIYSRLLEIETPTVHESPHDAEENTRGVGNSQNSRPSPGSGLTFSPEAEDDGRDRDAAVDQSFAWLTQAGIFHGSLLSRGATATLGSKVFGEPKWYSRSRLPRSEGSKDRRRAVPDSVQAIVLSQWHVLALVESRIVGINRLDEHVAYDQIVLGPGQVAIGLVSDPKKNTYWLFTSEDIFEITVHEEDRDVWRIMLEHQNFDSAMHYARGTAQKDVVATASGDYLIKRGKYLEAAGVFGKSTKPFEEVALTFIDHDEQDALRKYLMTKIATYKRPSIMQRVMIASWLVEIFMAKLNGLDDTISTKAELTENTTTADTKDELSSTRVEFERFLRQHKEDLDPKTTYEIISSHGRERELLAYATVIDDHNYVLSYMIQRHRWRDALDVLKKQTDPSAYYKHSTVFMVNEPAEFVDILMRHPDLDPRKLIPALLDYAEDKNAPLAQNQAARYLQYCINQLGSTDASVHNTLISIYASNHSPSENALLAYLSAYGSHPYYDADFALRLCIQHSRIQSCVHIYSLMGQYDSAVSLALKHDEVELAALVADRPADSNPTLRKKLWLAVAKKVIQKQGTGSIKTAIEFLKRCELLRIEDLIPFFPDFVVIDDFKDEICQALESYSRHIDELKKEMDESATTAKSIKEEIKALDRRYAIVEPGESCRVCGLPLLSRQFFVFASCQHGFHSDCLGKKVVEGSGMTVRARIRELQASIARGTGGAKREREMRELDGLIGKECILCNDFAIKLIEAPFVTSDDDTSEWAL